MNKVFLTMTATVELHVHEPMKHQIRQVEQILRNAYFVPVGVADKVTVKAFEVQDMKIDRMENHPTELRAYRITSPLNTERKFVVNLWGGHDEAVRRYGTQAGIEDLGPVRTA